MACSILGSGGFSHLELTDKHGAEALDRGAPAGGRNPYRRPQLRPCLSVAAALPGAQSGGRADFIVRLGWNALQLSNRARLRRSI